MRFRNVLCVFISFFCLAYAKAQTNLLLDTGRVGIGTTAPVTLLELMGSGVLENQPSLTLSTPSNSNIVSGSLLGMIQWRASDNSAGRKREQTAYIRQRATSTWNGTSANSYIGFGIRQNNTTFLDDFVVIRNTGRVGIGTSNPSSTLDVRGTIRVTDTTSKFLSMRSASDGNVYFNFDGGESGSYLGFQTDETNRLVVTRSGNIGIGTSEPSAKLEISGSSGTSSPVPVALKIRSTNGSDSWNTSAPWASLDFHSNDASGAGNAVRVRIGAYMASQNGASAGLKFFTITPGEAELKEQMVISPRGNVGMGISVPTHRLEVAGTIRANEVKVEAQWWDVVFEPDYDLMPVNDLRVFVQQHKHLPDIPSEAEVAANGVDVGNMTGLLLKKMEELTLYMLQQQEQIDSLLKLTEELKQENQRLNQQLSDQ